MKRLAGAVLALSFLASPALASDGRIGGSGEEYHVTAPGGSVTDRHFTYGRYGDDTYTGDWDGNGTETLAVRRGNRIYVKNSVTAGDADTVITYGRVGDQLVVGDWDGVGRDTFAVRRGSVYYVKNSITSGNADTVVVYGRAGDDVLVGDWDGDGKDTFAVRRGNIVHVHNKISSGPAQQSFALGQAGQQVLVGNWRGGRGDTLGLVDGRTVTLYRDLRGTTVHQRLVFGNGKDRIFAMDWNGDRVTELGARRSSMPTPFFVYGTLRPGQEAAHVVQGRYARAVSDRIPNLDLWITDHRFYRAWPWALPGKGGLSGELLYFPLHAYGEMTRTLDLWEGYTVGGDPAKMNYVRTTYRTATGIDTWVYVATPWRQRFVTNYGKRVPSGDITRY